MKDEFTKNWIIENSIEICRQYDKGILTLRALHYQLVSRGMTNDIQHYKRVVVAMFDARWEDLIDFDTFSDLDRAMSGKTSYQETILDDEIYNGKKQIEAWMLSYHKNKWENQPYYPEVFIEKKALQGVFSDLLHKWDVGLGACKGYPSLTFLYEAALRFEDAISSGKNPLIIYFGDYDPSGEDIPRSIEENLSKFGVDVEVRRIALMEYQVLEWQLPPAPAKNTDSRTANWTGLGQVELDAIRPEKLISLCEDALKEIFDEDLYDQLLETENEERIIYQTELKNFVNDLKS
jgi:hypothetical protein